MAQAVFDFHPLASYLHHAGEMSPSLPGISSELLCELDPHNDDDDNNDNDDLPGPEWRPRFLAHFLDFTSSPSPFVERFKYAVISSSLLSTSLSAPQRRSPPLSIPGQLNHSRSPSLQSDGPPLVPVETPPPSYILPSLALGFLALALNSGHILLIAPSLAVTVYVLKHVDHNHSSHLSPAIDSLNDLIATVNEWEFIVQQTLSTLEKEEQSSTPYSTGSSSPGSPIRLALASSLLTTQSQCDNVRHLFSALTCPAELSQLSEMYAPPSPSASVFAASVSTPARPLSLSPLAAQQFQQDRARKRQTWGGSHARPFGPRASPFATPLPHSRRRSDLNAIFDSRPPPTPTPQPLLTSQSAPTTPPGDPCASADEEDDVAEEQSIPPVTFGQAALGLRRDRINAGMVDVFGPTLGVEEEDEDEEHMDVSVPSTPPSRCRHSSLHSLAVPGSRFTTAVPSGRLSPLSVSATGVSQALQGALGSKRYACAHLLALRFREEEGDEGYWEDVRSVMGLMTSVFVDAGDGLRSVVMEVEGRRVRDGRVTPVDGEERDGEVRGKRVMEGGVSFAPMPSDLSRFVVHVEAIGQALEGAKEDLEECLGALRREVGGGGMRRSRRRRRGALSSEEVEGGDEEGEGGRALKAYERLRRELGLALRECERGRERLMDVVYPAREEEDGDEEDGDVPGLGHDASDESDKPDPLDVFDSRENSRRGSYEPLVVGVDAGEEEAGGEDREGDGVFGVEQVYEAEEEEEDERGGVGVFGRERSKLTREERIKAVKARRAAVVDMVDMNVNASVSQEVRGGERWGPGGDVVQELKDVIWRVGEKRRKMADEAVAVDKVQTTTMTMTTTTMPVMMTSGG